MRLCVLKEDIVDTVKKNSVNARGKQRLSVLGSFVVDLAIRTPKLPRAGETIFAGPFMSGAGGKGSNQAIAAALSGVEVNFVSKTGKDVFAQIGHDFWKKAGISDEHIFSDDFCPTGAALIMVEESTSQNMITVAPGACLTLSASEVERGLSDIKSSKYLLTQLETNLESVTKALEMAVEAGVKVILNPAPIQRIPESYWGKIDYLTPNETEAASLCERKECDMSNVEELGKLLLSRGVKKGVLITMGKDGVWVQTSEGGIWRIRLK